MELALTGVLPSLSVGKARHIFIPFSSPFFGVKFLYDYGLRGAHEFSLNNNLAFVGLG
jgi:hypothetical protein